jgi:hypothetical protein
VVLPVQFNAAARQIPSILQPTGLGFPYLHIPTRAVHTHIQPRAASLDSNDAAPWHSPEEYRQKMIEDTVVLLSVSTVAEGPQLYLFNT